MTKKTEAVYEKTIRMPKKLWKKWDKALRSGAYKQGKGVLYDEETASFCCLGVLQHCATDGEVEVYEDAAGEFANMPSLRWLESNGIRFSTLNGYGNDDPSLPSLGRSSNGNTHSASSANDEGKRFITIANAIARHVEFTD